MNKTKKTSGYEVLSFAALWVLTYSISLVTLKKLSPDTTTGLVLSFLPVLSFALFIYHLIKGVVSMDEVQIRIQMEAAVIAFSLGLLLLMTLGLLDLVVTLNKEDWGYRHLIPFFVIFYLIGLFISKRKYS